MTINIKDSVFDRLRQMSVAEATAERDRLITEARDLLQRSDDHLAADDEERFGVIEADIEFLAHRHATLQRMMGLVDSGSTEGGTPFQSKTPKQTRALEGVQVLTREQNVSNWLHDNTTAEQAQSGSFDRYLRGIVTGNWSGATEERAMSEGTSTAGGHLVPTALSANVIDLARASSVVIRAGAVTVPMTTQTLKVPRLTNEGSPAWRAENDPVTAADMVFDSVTFTARSLDRLVILSRELFEDSDPSAGDVISQAFAAQIALEIDRVALRGSGTPPEPKGVLNHTNVTITNHGAAGGAIANYDWFLDAIGTVRDNNFEPTGHILAPRSITSLTKLKQATTNAYLVPPTGVLPMYPTKLVPTTLTVTSSTDCSEIYTAQWDQLAIGIRTGFEIRFLAERYADNQQVAFLAHLRADVQVLQPKAFNVDLGVRA